MTRFARLSHCLLIASAFEPDLLFFAFALSWLFAMRADGASAGGVSTDARASAFSSTASGAAEPSPALLASDRAGLSWPTEFMQ